MIFPVVYIDGKKALALIKGRPRADTTSDNSSYSNELKVLKAWVQLFHDMCRSAEGNADHAGLFSLYLSTKRLYKQAVDHAKRAGTGNFIDNAVNPCKAAWSVINSNRN